MDGFSWFIIVAIVLIVLFLVLIIIAFVYDSWLIGALALLFLFIAIGLIIYWEFFAPPLVCSPNFTGPNCDICAAGFTGPNCTPIVCRPHFTGPNCNICITGFTGPDCNTCSVGFTGPNCVPIVCPTGFAGPTCNICAVGFTGPNCLPIPPTPPPPGNNFVGYGDILYLQNTLDQGYADPCGGTTCDPAGTNLTVTTRTDQSYCALNGNNNNLRKWQISSTTGSNPGIPVRYGDVITLRSMAINTVGNPPINPQFNMAVCTQQTNECGRAVIVGAIETALADRWIIQRDRSNTTSNPIVSYEDVLNIVNQNFGTIGQRFLNTCNRTDTGGGCGFSLAISSYSNIPFDPNNPDQYHGSSLWRMRQNVFLQC